MNKICSKCKKEKSVKDFYKDKKLSDNLMSACKSCNYVYDAHRIKRNNIKKRYGLTWEEYVSLHESQDGKWCRIV